MNYTIKHLFTFVFTNIPSVGLILLTDNRLEVINVQRKGSNEYYITAVR